MIKNYQIEKKQAIDVSFDMHLHEKYEVNFILDDGVDVFVNETLYTSKRGDIFIFPPFCFHRLNFNKIKYSRFLIFFDKISISESANALSPALDFFKNTQTTYIPLRGNDIDTFTEMLEHAFSIQGNHGIFSDFENICAFGHILSFMISKINIRKVLNPQKNSQDVVIRILTYITENLDRELTVPSICKKFNISKSTLWNLMKQSTGISMKEYILNRRIAKATDLLLDGFSVTEVSNLCGFNSYSHFIRTFTRIVGQSPNAYKRNHL